MGFHTDDRRIRNTYTIADEKGLEYHFEPNDKETEIYPNTVDVIMTNAAGQTMTVRGESVGGGKIHIAASIMWMWTLPASMPP